MESFVDEIFICSKALVESHEWESEIASCLKVIVLETLSKIIKDKIPMDSSIAYMYTTDKDNTIFIDYLSSSRKSDFQRLDFISKAIKYNDDELKTCNDDNAKKKLLWQNNYITIKCKQF